MIRPAALDDIPALLAMGERFADKAKLTDHVGYDPDSMAATFAALIEAPEHIVLISETGAIGGTSCAHPFNHSHRIAQELFWWSEGREGLRLLTAFEEWARETCQSVAMIALEAVEPERVGRIYEKQGYAPLERGFVKVF